MAARRRDDAELPDLIALHEERAGELMSAVRKTFVAEKRQHGTRMYRLVRALFSKQPADVRASAAFLALARGSDDTDTYVFDAIGAKAPAWTRDDVMFLLTMLNAKKKPVWALFDDRVALVVDAAKKLAKSKAHASDDALKAALAIATR